MKVHKLLLLAGLLLLCTPVRAETDEALAKSYFKLGKELYDRADYEGALRQFDKAYQLSKLPALLFNMARCQESLGKHSQAIRLYRDYLKSNPSNAAMLKARIKNLERLVEKKNHAEGAAGDPSGGAPPPPDQQRPAPPTESPDSTGAGSSREDTATPAPATDPQQNAPFSAVGSTETHIADASEGSTGSSHPLRLPGWILVGSGAAVLVTGVALGLAASSKASELEDANKAGKEYAELKDTEDTGSMLNTLGITAMVVGSAAAITGAVFLYLDTREASQDHQAWVAPGVLPGGAVVSGGFSF